MLLMSMCFASLPAAAQGIVGAWSQQTGAVEGAHVVIFLGNGYYVHIENAKAAEAPHGRDGFERGTYAWNAGSGALSVTTLQDTNGDVGLSGLNGVANVVVRASGDVLTFSVPGEGPSSLGRVTGPNPIVGAWAMGVASGGAAWNVVVFFPDGSYMMAEHGPSEGGGMSGIEHGTYSWNAGSGVVTASRPPLVDTNGTWGFSHLPNPLVMQVSADRGTLNGSTGQESFTLTRVGAPHVAPPAPVANTVVEYYHFGFGHYFITASSDEIGKLDAGVFAGWSRTGRAFAVFPMNSAGAANVCRFFSTSFAPKSSHFYTPFADECATVKGNKDWQFEAEVFAMKVPAATGDCPSGSIRLYRLYNNGHTGAPNHRYTTDENVRTQMIAQGFVAEGFGALGVVGCVPQV
ncbi:MAG TPA: hypothetical protein VNE58_15840 [Casimicrobiaceae bacterium]|nr:hypothetical protein [Casimicrobiaceae bacterium]